MFPRQCVDPQRKLARKLYFIFLTELIFDPIFKYINLLYILVEIKRRRQH